jgi:FAD-dependent oxidoreductase family protein
MSTYDVIVVGGGTAGVVAAVQAGRAGAKTLLVEKNGMLGGTVTVAGVNFPALFFAWGRQVIGGIGWELVEKTLVETGEPLPDMQDLDAPHWKRHIHVNAAVFASLCDEAVVDAGVELLFHAMPARATREDDAWSVDICTKTGLRPVTAKVLIDTTADANVTQLAGFEVERGDVIQPATLIIHLSGYDAGALDMDAIQAAFFAARDRGEILDIDVGWHKNGPAGVLRSHGGNSTHVACRNADSSEGKTQLELDGRRGVMRMFRFLKKQPGLENLTIDWMCAETGLRETVRIVGKTRMTCEDYEAGRRYDDAVCHAFYSIDEHLNDGEGINYRRLKEGVLPTIPRGALLPAGSRGLIVAGRCIDGDREANSATRVEAPCMAMGQAAGAMAALSATTGLDPEDLPLPDLHALLQKHNAIVPE